jgi:hypothetical protein
MRCGFLLVQMMVMLAQPAVFLAAGHYVWGTAVEARLVWKVQMMRNGGVSVDPEDFTVSAAAGEANSGKELEAALAAMETKGAEDRWFNEVQFDSLKPRDIERLGKFLEARKASLDRIKLALEKPLVFPVQVKSPVVMTLLPHLNGIRGVANFLRAGAAYAHAVGRDAEALQYVHEIHVISRELGKQPFLVSNLVSIGISGLGADCVETMQGSIKIGGDGGASEQQIRQTLREMLDESWRTQAWRRSMDSERMSQIDCGWELLAGNQEIVKAVSGRSDTLIPIFLGPAQGVLRPIILSDVLWMMEFDQRAEDAVLSADWPTARRKLASGESVQELNPILHPVARLLTPSLDRAAFTQYRDMAERRLIATALALRWYTQDHQGKLPAKLEELTPKYLEKVPLDPMADGGKEIRYIAGTRKIYSVGEDGVDQGASEKPAKRQANRYRWNAEDAVLTLK